MEGKLRRYIKQFQNGIDVNLDQFVDMFLYEVYARRSFPMQLKTSDAFEGIRLGKLFNDYGLTFGCLKDLSDDYTVYYVSNPGGVLYVNEDYDDCEKEYTDYCERYEKIMREKNDRQPTKKDCVRSMRHEQW